MPRRYEIPQRPGNDEEPREPLHPTEGGFPEVGGKCIDAHRQLFLVVTVVGGINIRQKTVLVAHDISAFRQAAELTD